MNLAAIASVAISFAVVNAYLDGELVDWNMLPHLLRHASLFALVCMVGWVALKSPWAPSAREFIGTLIPGSTTVTTTTEVKRTDASEK